jgi:hypothetical protein
VSARAAFAAAAAVVLAAALVPWADGPLRRLAGGEGDGPQPRLDVPLDTRALRELGPRLPLGTTYLLGAANATPLEQGNLKAAAQLYLARGLPVQDAADAQLLVDLRDGRVVVERLR